VDENSKKLVDGAAKEEEILNLNVSSKHKSCLDTEAQLS
jgi:hypothetical protein